jgi:leader peptidase (prepilin peptidase)/N-methyltransferase
VATTVDPIIWIGFAFIYGLAIGSFLNVVIFRLPEGKSIVSPGSRCPGCETPIAWHDNIPVFSFVLLRGRCRRCRARISLRYPGVELFTGLVFALVAWRFGASWLALLYALFAAGLIAAAMIDFDHQIIPDEISLGGLACGLLLAPLPAWRGGAPYLDGLTESALGALLGGGLLWTVAFVHARVSVALGRTFEHWPGEGEEVPKPSSADYWLWFPGMGLGDVKLLAMVGVFLGPWGVLATILAASVFGLLLGLAFALITRSWSSPFGFGPAISGGAVLALLFPLRFAGLG